ncbi:NACHT and WD repeat domain-containing protein 2 isoform X2 [Mugil cephalus]|uniref:NACHT and WD repeat domain-containing protein 2 isoform X2 n=1 Tax=Mugil cephalus TaxID=48193 RepID=UPI001FB579CC|nr:NACHT and WD repeat domain-containing protein 2 isoform X2 [Mugil cephalus]
MRSRGKLDRSSSCVKIYLCSNPGDSVVERRALRESVFPRLREHCRHSLGLDVRVIDPFESSDPSRWPDETTRQRLIQECRESSSGPFLLALVGHQYGPGALPSQVEVSEYQLLLEESQRAGVSTQELESAYRRDENTIPSSYCLRPSHGSTCPPLKEVKEEEEEMKIKAKEEELRKVFQTAVSLCVQSGLMTPERGRSFCRSALDVDLRFALEKCPDEDIAGRCLVYVHKVVNAKGEREKKMTNDRLHPETESLTPTSDELLSELCAGFLPSLITSCQLLVYTRTTECDRRHGYTSTRRRGYAESLCQQVYSDLVELIGSLDVPDAEGDSPLCDAWSREQVEQEQLGVLLSRFYDISQPEEGKIRDYVERRDRRCPLVVTGGPCTGKTVLLAHCTQQMKSWLTDSDPVVITHFCNLSINTSPECLLSGLCRHIASRYHYNSTSKQNPSSSHGTDVDDPSCESRGNISNSNSTSAQDPHTESSTKECVSECRPKISHPDPRGLSSSVIKPDLSELKESLSSLCNLLPSDKHPLILILDGLDQLENEVGPEIINSLPSPLPPDVKLILSVTSNRTHLLQAVRLHYPQGSEKESGPECVQLGSVDRKQSVKMVASLLGCSGRRVTSGQQALVNQALTSCCLPLYARLLHTLTSLWHSDSDVTEASIPGGIHSSISSLLDHLEQKHSSSAVARAVSYLTLSRAGLAEAELADLLYDIRHSEGSKMQLPQVDVERLLLDLKSFLIKRTVAGSQVLSWVSRHFRLVAFERYLGSHDVRRKIHSEMADYFSGQWVCGSRKSFLLNQTSGTSEEPSMKIDQPYVFAPSKAVGGRVNLRKLIELPHHLQQSGRWKELEHELLMSLEFHQAMVQAGLLEDLVDMLESNEGESQFVFSRERLLLASAFKSSACFLQSSPLQLPAVMETSLLPYLEVLPALESYVTNIRQESRKARSGLGVALCPSPSSVPPIQYLKPRDKAKEVCVTETAGSECGIVAEVMDDGSAWIWKGARCDVVRLSLSCEQKELKFAGVKSSGGFFLLSTQCDKVFVWDVTGPEVLVEVRDSLKTELNQTTPGTIEGFVAYQGKLFICWKNESFVSVFDISSETLTHCQCQCSVTCLAFSSEGFCVYCGQEDGTVSIFDMETSSLLGSCPSANCSAVTSIIICGDKKEMACVDRNGNVALWDMGVKTQPPKLTREIFNRGKSETILSADYSKEINNLLVCQAHQVTLWDTWNWEMWDQFLAPRGRAFTQAVLSNEGHLFLALLDSCPHILGWRLNSGECVLFLETTNQPHTLLKMASNFICVTHGGCLTVWDSEVIDAAGTAPKMGCGVKGVVVDEKGEWFYTTDGSEKVWRWSLDTGLPHAYFLHDGPVEKLQLSPKSIHLVSLSGGDIYVWKTETGEDILRISGSRATNVLITPNGNCGVSISERGLSRVWKMTQGSIVCCIRLHLSDAQVSPESTFLIGRHSGDLVAASLWSGSISKRFSCVESSERVVAFHALSEHPEFVVVMTESGAVYTWKVAEETVCRHFQLPQMFHCQPQDFQTSSDGSYALLSIDNDSINLLDLSQVRLCSFKAEGPVIKACLDKTGSYAAHISYPSRLGKGCACFLHARPVLTVTRLSDGERIGSLRLPKSPLTLVVGDRQCVFVGFEDGSVGVYSVRDYVIHEKEKARCRESVTGQLKQCPFDRAPLSWVPQPKANITWS